MGTRKKAAKLPARKRPGNSERAQQKLRMQREVEIEIAALEFADRMTESGMLPDQVAEMLRDSAARVDYNSENLALRAQVKSLTELVRTLDKKAGEGKPSAEATAALAIDRRAVDQVIEKHDRAVAKLLGISEKHAREGCLHDLDPIVAEDKTNGTVLRAAEQQEGRYHLTREHLRLASMIWEIEHGRRGRVELSLVGGEREPLDMSEVAEQLLAWAMKCGASYG